MADIPSHSITEFLITLATRYSHYIDGALHFVVVTSELCVITTEICFIANTIVSIQNLITWHEILKIDASFIAIKVKTDKSILRNYTQTNANVGLIPCKASL